MLAFNFFEASFIRFISWFHSLCSGNFLNFFLLNKWVNSQIYSNKSSRLVGFNSFPISCCPLFLSSIGYNLYILDININIMSDLQSLDPSFFWLFFELYFPFFSFLLSSILGTGVRVGMILLSHCHKSHDTVKITSHKIAIEESRKVWKNNIIQHI